MVIRSVSVAQPAPQIVLPLQLQKAELPLLRAERPKLDNYGADYLATLQKMALGMPESALETKPLRDGKEAFAARLELVNQAKTTILCTTYAIVHDKYGVEFIDALTEAAKRGVKVVLGLDELANVMASTYKEKPDHDAFEAALARFEEAGGQVAWYATAEQQLKENLGSGNHFKALVVDGDKAIMGGRNIGQDYVTDWTDFEMYMRGPIAAQISERALLVIKHSERPEDDDEFMKAIGEVRFDMNVARVRGRRLLTEARMRDEKVSAPFYLVSWDPTFGRDDFPQVPRHVNPVTEALIATFDRASDSIVLSSNYVWGVPELQESLINAAKRGVRVTIVTTSEEASPGMALVCYLGTADQYKAMQQVGVRIREATTHEHGKMYVIDDTIAAFGSYNVEWAADGKLAEGLLFTRDRDTVAAIRSSLTDTIDNRSKLVDTEKKHGFFESIGRFFMRAFDYLFHIYV